MLILFTANQCKKYNLCTKSIIEIKILERQKYVRNYIKLRT